MGDKGSVATAGFATVILNVIVHGNSLEIMLENLLHVPTMVFNLMLVGMIEERCAAVSFKNDKAIINVCGKDFSCDTRKSGLYHLGVAHQRHFVVVTSLQLWHERYGDVKIAGVKWIIKQNDVDGIK